MRLQRKTLVLGMKQRVSVTTAYCGWILALYCLQIVSGERKRIKPLYAPLSPLDDVVEDVGIPSQYKCRCHMFDDFRSMAMSCHCINKLLVPTRDCYCQYKGNKTKLECACESLKQLKDKDPGRSERLSKELALKRHYASFRFANGETDMHIEPADVTEPQNPRRLASLDAGKKIDQGSTQKDVDTDTIAGDMNFS